MSFSTVKVVLCSLLACLLIACSGSSNPRPKETSSSAQAQSRTDPTDSNFSDSPFSDSPFAPQPDSEEPEPRPVAQTNPSDSPFGSDSVFAERTDDYGYESGLSQLPERAEEEVEFAPQDPVAERTPAPVAERTPAPVAERTPAPVVERTPAPNPSPDQTRVAVAERPPAPKPQINPGADATIAELARELTRDQKTDRDKAQAIYTWLCQSIDYDTVAYFSGDFGDNSAETVLRRRSGVCAGYANLFTALAEEAGMKSMVVVGHSKGYGSQPGQGEEGGKHAWNVVQIDGQWALLDATWGSGYIDDQKQFIRRVSQDWFLTPPKAFIYTHLPDDNQWQLLPEAVSKAEYERLPEVNPSFFRYGLELGQPDDGFLECDRELTFQLSSATGARIHANIARGKERLPLESVMVFRDGKKVTIKTRFPEPGDYKVLFFASLPDEEGSSHVMSCHVKAGGSAASLFPYTYRDYEERDCELLDGFDSKLKAGTRNTIKVRVPGASKVTAKHGGERTAFEKSGDVFTLELNPEPGDVKILTHYPGRRRLPVILKYEAM